MKKLILLVAFALPLLLTSCSLFGTKARATLAEKVGVVVEKLINDKVGAAQVCEADVVKAEAEAFGSDVENFVGKLLKAVKETKEAAIAVGVTADDGGNKSLVGDAAQLICKGLLGKGLPLLAANKFDEYPCTVKYFGVKMVGVADDVCNKIKL